MKSVEYNFGDVIIVGHLNHVNKVEHLSKVDQIQFITQEERPTSLTLLLEHLLGFLRECPTTLCNGYDLCLYR